MRLTPEERSALSGELDALTDREREVALAICDGGSNEAVAERLYIALPTLRTHLMRINQKLGTKSKGDVVRLMVGRLLEAYRTGRIGRAAEPGLGSGGSHRIAEAKPLHTNHFDHESMGGESPDSGDRIARPGLARAKIIDTDDDSRIGLARMAGSL
ncbi:MAG: helix-turn-helix domain-containing protein [Phycisphaerales bacterium]